MNACQEIISSTAKLVDASKYNLRCNRNISEKMTKKDFIYDIRTPTQTMRKVLIILMPIDARADLQRFICHDMKIALLESSNILEFQRSLHIHIN